MATIQQPEDRKKSFQEHNLQSKNFFIAIVDMPGTTRVTNQAMSWGKY